MPIDPIILIPTSVELNHLYAAAEVYREAAAATWERWSGIRYAEVNKHLARLVAADLAYADQEYGRLNSLQEIERANVDCILDDLNRRYQGIDLPSCGPYLLNGHNGMDRYINSIKSSLRSFVQGKWSEANEEQSLALRGMVNVLPKASEFTPGMLLYHDAKLLEITKITHKGKRITARNIKTDQTFPFKPNQDERRYYGSPPYRVIGVDLCEVLMTYDRAFEAFVASHGLADAA